MSQHALRIRKRRVILRPFRSRKHRHRPPIRRLNDRYRLNRPGQRLLVIDGSARSSASPAPPLPPTSSYAVSQTQRKPPDPPAPKRNTTSFHLTFGFRGVLVPSPDSPLCRTLFHGRVFTHISRSARALSRFLTLRTLFHPCLFTHTRTPPEESRNASRPEPEPPPSTLYESRMSMGKRSRGGISATYECASTFPSKKSYIPAIFFHVVTNPCPSPPRLNASSPS